MAELKLTDFAQRGYSRLLLVEGDDDGSFIYALVGHLGLKEKIFVYKVGGKHQFTPSLTVLLQSAEFENLSHLAIIRDADFNTDAVASLRQSLENANRRNEHRKFPIPASAGEVAGDELKVSFFVLPQSGVEGMLENLLIDALADDAIMACVDTYIQCLKDSEISLKSHVLPKAKIHLFLAGNAVDANNRHEDSEIWELQHMFKLERWKWNHSAFEPIKTFLRQLIE